MDLEFKKKQSVLTKYHIDPDTKKPITVPVVEKQQVHPLKNLIQMVGEVKKNKKIQIIDRDMIPVNKPEKITQPYHYYVDYEQNLIHFHPDIAGQTVEYKYEDMGVTVISANKIFTKQDEKGNVIELLEDIIRLGREAIDVMETIGGVAIVMKRLEDDIKEGYEVSDKIQADIKQAKDEILNVRGNKEVIIKTSDWTLNVDVYEKEITHDLNSENLHVTAKNSDTKEAVTIGYKIVDKTRILLKSDEAINMSVILSASYYHATQTISDNIAEEVIKARKGELDLKTKIDSIDNGIVKVNEQLDNNMNYTKEISINVKMFGAIGDDKLHLLSEKFTTLEEAQKVYPSATSLNDSIDSVAIQKAIDSYNIEIYSGGVPKNGGIVYIPMGQYRLNKTIKMKKGIQLIGCGTGGTYLSWSALNTIGIEYEEDAESTSIKDLTILDVANGILIRTSNYCNFERLALHGCYNNGIEIQNGVCNTFEGIKITGSRYGIYFNTQMGSTTQYFKDIHISRATHTGFRIEGNEYGLSQCILENVICEYCGVYGIYMDCNTWHTRSNIFKRIWLEGNVDYGFYYKNGNYGTLDEIYADPGTNQTVLVEGGECVNIKNIQGNLNITSSQTYYIDGYVSGSESYTHPNKMVRFNKDNYKKYTSDNTTAILTNAWAYITGDTSGKAEGIFLVTVKDKEVGIRDYKTVIYNFKAGEYIEKTELSGTMGLVENEGGTVANANGREVIITIELLSTMTPH